MPDGHHQVVGHLPCPLPPTGYHVDLDQAAAGPADPELVAVFEGPPVQALQPDGRGGHVTAHCFGDGQDEVRVLVRRAGSARRDERGDAVEQPRRYPGSRPAR